jgi:glutathione S-transferase
MTGQAAHFMFYAPEKIPYAIDRYKKEALRLISVLESLFTTKGHQFLTGEKYTIADTKTFPWVRIFHRLDLSLDEYPGVKQWVERCEARPGVTEGLAVPPA